MRSPDPNRWTINLENVSGRGQTGAPNPSPRTFRDPSNARQRLLHLLARYALSGLSFRETTRCVVQPYKVGTRYSDNGSRSGTDAGGVGLGLALGLALVCARPSRHPLSLVGLRLELASVRSHSPARFSARRSYHNAASRPNKYRSAASLLLLFVVVVRVAVLLIAARVRAGGFLSAGAWPYPHPQNHRRRCAPWVCANCVEF